MHTTHATLRRPMQLAIPSGCASHPPTRCHLTGVSPHCNKRHNRMCEPRVSSTPPLQLAAHARMAAEKPAPYSGGLKVIGTGAAPCSVTQPSRADKALFQASAGRAPRP